MSFAEIPAETDAERILLALDQVMLAVRANSDAINALTERVGSHADAINGLGKNVQWIVDNVQGIFQMFGDPSFMAMIPGMTNPAAMAAAAEGMATDG